MKNKAFSPEKTLTKYSLEGVVYMPSTGPFCFKKETNPLSHCSNLSLLNFTKTEYTSCGEICKEPGSAPDPSLDFTASLYLYILYEKLINIVEITSPVDKRGLPVEFKEPTSKRL